MTWTLWLALLACAPPDDTGPADTAASSPVGGFVHKGPMATGGDVTIEVLDADGVTTSSYETKVLDDDGTFAFDDAPRDAALRITAVGPAFDEVAGDVSTDDVTLSARVTADTEQVHLNVWTTLVDLAAGEGADGLDALDDTWALVRATLRTPAFDEEPWEVSLADDTLAGAVLAVTSIIVSEAAEDYGGTPLEAIGAELSVDGVVPYDVGVPLARARLLVDYDAADLALTGALSSGLTDLSVAIDRDGDRRPDVTDGCPYAWDPNQPDADADGITDGCEPDFDVIRSGPTICGLMDSEPHLRCATPSITGLIDYSSAFVPADIPILPDNGGPWRDVVHDDELACGLEVDGGVVCVDLVTRELTRLREDVATDPDAELALHPVSGILCIVGNERLSCYDRTDFPDETFEAARVRLVAIAGQVCFEAIDYSGAQTGIQCVDGGVPVNLINVPDGNGFRDLSMATTSRYGIAIDSDGGLQPFNLESNLITPPDNGPYDAVRAGSAVFCARVEATGVLDCWVGVNPCPDPFQGVTGDVLAHAPDAFDVRGCQVCTQETADGDVTCFGQVGDL